MSLLTLLLLLGWLVTATLAGIVRRRARAARAEHLARVAHELRGPLHAAGLVLHSARRAAPDGPCARALVALEVELDRAAQVTGDLCPGSGRRGRDDRTAAACDVAALVRDLSAGWAALAASRGRSLEVELPDGPLWATGRRLRVAQILGNLVANAAEHGDGTVHVDVGADDRGHPVVEVRDAGPGLPASVAELAARAGDPGRARGRGLAIAAALASEAGGRLSAAPAGCGARLVLRLGAPPAPVGRAAATASVPVAS